MMLSYLDWVFVGAGFLICSILVGLIVAIRSIRPPLQIHLPRQEPELRPHWDVPPVMQPRDEYHVVNSNYRADLVYPGFTGMVHLHGVENGDTFRAMVTDGGTKCRLEKTVRVKA